MDPAASGGSHVMKPLDIQIQVRTLLGNNSVDVKVSQSIPWDTIHVECIYTSIRPP